MLLSPLLVSLNRLRDQNYLLSSLPQLNNPTQLQQQHLPLSAYGQVECKFLNKMNYSKCINNSVYYLEIKPIFCQSSAWSKKILNFHLSALIAMDTFCQCSSTFQQLPMVYIKSLNGCSPWSRPGSLRLFIFIFFPPPASHHTPSQFFCTKLGKKHYEILLCCKVSATLNLGIVFPSRLLEVKYLQGTDSKLTCTETTMMQELTMFNSSVCLPVEISTIYFFTEVCAHTNSHRLKEKWEPSTSNQQ